MHVLRLELEITENVTEVSTLLPLRLLALALIWPSLAMLTEVVMRGCFRKASCAAELCGSSDRALGEDPPGRGSSLMQPLCLLFHRERTPWCPSGRRTAVGRTPLLGILLTNPIQ